jgi:6-phosphogluconolactonase (cycloisomerase 2 family)
VISFRLLPATTYYTVSLLLACTGNAGTDTVVAPLAPTTTSREFIFATALTQNNGGPNESLLLYEKTSSSCALTLLNTHTVGPDPYDLVYHAATKTLYVANSYNGTINAFKFDPSSAQLTSAGTATQTGPNSPGTPPTTFMMAIHANGFLYAADGRTNGTIGIFSQNQTTGTLAQFTNPNQYVSTSTQIWFTALVGNHLYVTDYNSNLIRQYSINPTTGLLTALGTPTIATPANPWSIFVHNSGNFVYTANSSGTGTVSQYSRNTTSGQLTQIAAPVSTGSRTISIAVGTNYLFAGGNTANAIYRFSIDQTTGMLTALTPPSVTPQQARPYGMTLSRDEKCLYVAELTTDDGSATDVIAVYNVSNGLPSFSGQSFTVTGPRFFAVAY